MKKKIFGAMLLSVMSVFLLFGETVVPFIQPLAGVITLLWGIGMLGMLFPNGHTVKITRVE